MECMPPEIITHIMEYLPFIDRRQMSMVNKLFYYASIHPVFLQKELIVYQPDKHLEDYQEILFRSPRKQFCLKAFQYVYIGDTTIYENLAERLVSLDFDHLIMLGDEFLDAFVQFCPNLQAIKMKRVSYMTLTDKDRKPMLSLTSLSFSDMKFSDYDLNLIFKVTPNLKDLGIFNCHIANSSKIISRFYPSHRTISTDPFNKYDSNNILSDLNIIHHLNNSVRLSSLRLNQNSSIFYQIQPIQPELKCLILQCNNVCEPFDHVNDPEKLKLVLGQYVFLERLEIFEMPIDTLSAISTLHNLRHFKLSYVAHDVISTSEEGILYLNKLLESIKNMKYIKTLALYRADDQQQIELPILKIPGNILEPLVSLDCTLSSDLEALTLCRNLTFLQIRNGEILKVEDLQLLFQNLTKLQDLCIDQCHVLDDEVFMHLPISNLKGLITLKITQADLTYHCLEYIKNPNLKILSLSKLSIEPCSSVLELDNFARSLQTLSRSNPTLSEFKCYICDTDFRTLDAFTISKYVPQNLLTYVQNDFTTLIKSYFRKLNVFTLFK